MSERPISAVQVRVEDWDEYCRLRDRIGELVLKDIAPVWGFLHKAEPVLTFQGCEIIGKSA